MAGRLCLPRLLNHASCKGNQGATTQKAEIATQHPEDYPMGLPGSDTEHRAGGDAQRVLRLDEVHIFHPGMGIFDVNHALGEGACHDPIESAAEA